MLSCRSLVVEVTAGYNMVSRSITVNLKGIVHFEINFWYVLSYLKGIQDVGVFVSALFSILIFLGQTVLVYYIMQVYGHHLKEHAQRSPN